LLLTAHSSSSLACMGVGVAIFFALGIPAVRVRARRLWTYGVLGGVGLWALNSVFDLWRVLVVDILGRDLTLTTRTEVWPMLIAQSESVLVGAGFNSFWTGERLAVINAKLGIIQAHNGYLETYLNGGVVGVVLLLILLFAAAQAIKISLASGSDFARIRLMFLVIVVVYNFSEAFFNKQSILWFVQLLVTIEYPRPRRAGAAERTGAPFRDSQAERTAVHLSPIAA
jgi:exopolysaccharide production protein ExoQ